jgi:dethiobiotin synthetase
MLSVYVTGTDTGIGKTVASVALLHALRARVRNAVGMKPVASGCERVDGEWRNADALALREASHPAPPYALVNPIALSEPAAPEIAAVVQGVGGWLAPLAPRLDQSALVHALDLPVVLVVGVRLGCINHARLTQRAIEADGCRLAGWIGNRIDPDFATADASIDLLRRHLSVPCLGVIDHAGEGMPKARFDLGPLSSAG